jgi:hypothetical protein
MKTNKWYTIRKNSAYGNMKWQVINDLQSSIKCFWYKTQKKAIAQAEYLNSDFYKNK